MNAEKCVCRTLDAEFGKKFSGQKLRVGRQADGTPGTKAFDAVSEDGRIIAMVKDYSAENLVGNRTRLARVSHDLLLLHLAKADTKFMYLSKPFYAWFETPIDAVVPPDVEVRCIP